MVIVMPLFAVSMMVMRIAENNCAHNIHQQTQYGNADCLGIMN